MNPDERMTALRQRLEKAFSPTKLEIQDDSEKHRGHAGAQSGAGHYTVILQAECLQGLTRVEAHRKVYAAVGDLIPREIHALAIKLT